MVTALSFRYDQTLALVRTYVKYIIAKSSTMMSCGLGGRNNASAESVRINRRPWTRTDWSLPSLIKLYADCLDKLYILQNCPTVRARRGSPFAKNRSRVIDAVVSRVHDTNPPMFAPGPRDFLVLEIKYQRADEY
jgi:hypothetical protein